MAHLPPEPAVTVMLGLIDGGAVVGVGGVLAWVTSRFEQASAAATSFVRESRELLDATGAIDAFGSMDPAAQVATVALVGAVAALVVWWG